MLLIIYFRFFIFVVYANHEYIFTTKISRSRVNPDAVAIDALSFITTSEYSFSFFCRSLGFYGVGRLLCFFLSELPAIGYVQYLFMHLAPQNMYIGRASCTVLPFLRRQETLSRRHHVMYASNILPRCERNLTFRARPQIDIPKRDQHVLMYIYTNTRTVWDHENRSPIQSLTLMRSAISLRRMFFF